VKNKKLDFKNNFKSIVKRKGINKKLTKDFTHFFYELKKEIKDKNKTLNVLNQNYTFKFKISQLNKFKKFKTVAIIGMGGSILGAEAMHNFFGEKIKKKIYFFNDIDENRIIEFKKKEVHSKVLFIIISKSGNTIETLSNVFSLNIIKKNSNNIIIISEKKNNCLYNLSKKMNLFFIEHRSSIGGRYSVLSETGLVPAYLMGIDIKKLRSSLSRFLNKKNMYFLKDSAINLANILKSKNLNNLILLNYSPKLEKLLFWIQQLIAESLGKNNKGFFPVISNVPKDHHSLLQLYLDGPKDKIFYVFNAELNPNIRIDFKYIDDEKKYLKNRFLNTIKIAQKNALIKSLKKNNLPFREFNIKKIDENTLGQLFSYFILETVLIGKLSKINPYDQPAVEQVKIYTKQHLN
tara:strand:- start:617 stop:1834 length:1218 start_codon:yes stop_codon:yes gene_type:complete